MPESTGPVVPSFAVAAVAAAAITAAVPLITQLLSSSVTIRGFDYTIPDEALVAAVAGSLKAVIPSRIIAPVVGKDVETFAGELKGLHAARLTASTAMSSAALAVGQLPDEAVRTAASAQLVELRKQFEAGTTALQLLLQDLGTADTTGITLAGRILRARKLKEILTGQFKVLSLKVIAGGGSVITHKPRIKGASTNSSGGMVVSAVLTDPGGKTVWSKTLWAQSAYAEITDDKQHGPLEGSAGGGQGADGPGHRAIERENSA